MIKKERELKGNNKKINNKENKISKEEDVKVVTKSARNLKPPKQEKENVSKEGVVDQTGVKPNFHSDKCKTCVKMEKLMGEILPHPVNI